MLKGKNVVVIGGTTGLGLSAALALVNNGARVVITGRNQDSCKHAQDQLGDLGLAICSDATS